MLSSTMPSDYFYKFKESCSKSILPSHVYTLNSCINVGLCWDYMYDYSYNLMR